MARYYIAIKMTSPDDIAPVIDLMISSLPCKTTIHRYRGEILIFHVEPTGPIADIVKKVRRLGRGKRRFTVEGVPARVDQAGCCGGN